MSSCSKLVLPWSSITMYLHVVTIHVFVLAFPIKPSLGADANRTSDSDHVVPYYLKTTPADVKSISSWRGRHGLDINSTQVVLQYGTRLACVVLVLLTDVLSFNIVCSHQNLVLLSHTANGCTRDVTVETCHWVWAPKMWMRPYEVISVISIQADTRILSMCIHTAEVGLMVDLLLHEYMYWVDIDLNISMNQHKAIMISSVLIT